jgi:hypothetical protein
MLYGAVWFRLNKYALPRRGLTSAGLLYDGNFFVVAKTLIKG